MAVGRALSANAQNVNWLLANFTDNDVFVEQTIAVSSDGLLMAASSSLDRGSDDRLAAVVSGLRSLSEGGARVMGKGSVNQVIVEMDHGYLFVTSISDGSVLGVLTSRDADLAAVGYETTLLVDRVGSILTPEIVAELKGGLGA
jgi:predicted regulator of Ras-like GTPase activity (Roadblock/LC7/MglB family)